MHGIYIPGNALQPCGVDFIDQLARLGGWPGRHHQFHGQLRREYTLTAMVIRVN